MPAKPLFVVALALITAGAWAWWLWARDGAGSGAGPDSAEASRAVAVEVAAVEQGPIAQRRVFTGTLAPLAEQVIAPKIAGRIAALAVDLADPVRRGQVVARLDNHERVQAVAQAEADLAVAEANLREAESLLGIAERELERIEQLSDRGLGSEAQRDQAKAEQLAKAAHVAVTRAQTERARAALAAARIRLGYTEVAASWHAGDDQRVVAERYVDEGETVAANEPLLRVVALDPLKAVCSVSERDYARLAVGQEAALRTDAFPGEVFAGRIARIAPVFRETTRQARVELRVPNPDQRLKPGMFVRATVVLARVADASIVPQPALTTRDGQTGLFVLDADGGSVRWQPVRVGLRDQQRVQVSGADLRGARIVTLGQQLLEDGSPVRLPQAEHAGSDPLAARGGGAP
jgi:RND family efflux transporter MFP subunit